MSGIARPLRPSRNLPRMADFSSQERRLDSKTIFRFSHGFDHGGGIEQYIDDLNSLLSSRHRIHTVQLRLTTGDTRQEVVELNGSRLTTYFVKAANYQSSHSSPSFINRLLNRTRNSFRDHVLYQQLLNRLFFRQRLAAREAPRGITDPQAVLECTKHILNSHKIDVAVLHSFGNRDSQLVLRELNTRTIPVGLVNHFSNDRLANSAAREQVNMARRIGAVSRADIPGYLAGRCDYVGDGIDTVFFRRGNAVDVESLHEGPRIFLPARLVRSKGHLDLIAAAHKVSLEGVPLHLYFAGREDSIDYVANIRSSSLELGLSKFVHIVGPQDREQLRNWYAGSLATVLPSSHHEGLPRILLESQAMGVPCIAYDIGGVREGFIDNESGLLVPLGNVSKLAQALLALARNEDRRRHMGETGRAFIETHFSFKALAERHETFILALNPR